MKLTPEQHTAVYTHDRNLIVLAGAGSGKTRVLVERFLALLDRNRDWPLNALVAITFTKKAAGEMRDRVRAGLEAHLNSVVDDPALAQIWAARLAAMDSARIDTIHGLCASLLRANAAEAAIDPEFVVLEETDTAILLDDVIDAALRRAAAENDESLRLFEHYPSADIRRVLRNNLLLSEPPALDNDPLARWQAIWEADAPIHLSAFAAQVERIGTVEPAGDALGAVWTDLHALLDQFWEAYHAGSISACLEAITLIAAARRGNAGSEKNWGGREGLALAKARFDHIRAAARDTLALIGEPPGAIDARAAEMLRLWIPLIHRVSIAFREAKDASGALDFDDLERRTRDLLIGHPAVAARYRGREFRHLLVDEFQDTNAAQWSIIQALTGLDVPGSLFVVGDEKQSIYAFRGADVSVFGAVRAQITTARGEALALAQSFRTHDRLVTGFNAIFERLLVREPASPVSAWQVEFGERMTAYRADPSLPGPWLEFLLIDDDCSAALESDGSLLIAPPARGKFSADHCRRWEAYEIARRLQARVAAGQFEYGDVAILFQSFSSIDQYEDVFKTAGLPFVTLGGRGYYNRQEVWDVINLLQALHHPEHDLALASVLRSPVFGLSDDALLALRLMTDADGGTLIPLWRALAADDYPLLPDEERSLARWAGQTLAELRALAGRVTISELIREALTRTGYLATLTALPDGDRRRENILKLLDKAASTGKVTLGAFSRYLLDLSAREARESEAPVEARQAVTLMTVHASKGLEFPVVALANASWERGAGGDPAVVIDPVAGLACSVPDEADDSPKPFAFRRAAHFREAREAAERLRLLYVAATRAKDHLMVSGTINTTSESRGGKGWLGQLIAALDLGDRLADGLIDNGWGGIQIRIPTHLPPQEIMRPRVSEPAWESHTVQTGQVFPGPAIRPRLLNVVALRPAAAMRHLAATHIADLGSVAQAEAGDERRFYRERFRRRVLQDAPSYVEWIGSGQRRVSARQIGEIVHEALRYWRLPGDMSDTDYFAMLDSYAWRQGITHASDRRDAVNQSFRLLSSVSGSDLYQQVAQARAIYRELPFIDERDGYILHGIIDVLMRDRSGQWALLDYKTGFVRGGGDPDVLRWHARRYHLQLGIYAEAVEKQLGGVVPKTGIYYIRHQYTVEVTEPEWRAALAQSLPDRIQALLEDRT